MADLTHDSAEDAFHEIQLSGKQLVFLFMATTVISVIIFLCGVSVGRKVGADEIAASSAVPSGETPAPPVDTATTRSEAEPGVPAPAPRLDFQQALDGKESARLVPKPEPAPAPEAIAPAPPEAAASIPEQRPAPVKPEPAPGAAMPGPKPGTWAVQVVSLKDRSTASDIVKRLRRKDYPAFLVAPAPGAPTQLYKVQVGKYADRTEAQRIETRLKKEEQFDPWIVR